MDVIRAALRSPARTALLVNGESLRYAIAGRLASVLLEHLGPINRAVGQNRYEELLARASSLAQVIKIAAADPPSSVGPTTGPRVALLAAPDRHYVEGMWATWLAGGISVPLCLSHPAEELAYAIEDSQSSLVLAAACLTDRVQPLLSRSGTALHVLDSPDVAHASSDSSSSSQAHDIDSSSSWQADAQAAVDQTRDENGALIIYTSGTTGKPKGIQLVHKVLEAFPAINHPDDCGVTATLQTLLCVFANGPVKDQALSANDVMRTSTNLPDWEQLQMSVQGLSHCHRGFSERACEHVSLPISSWMPSQRCLRSAAIQNQINAAVVLDLRWMLHMRTHRKSELVSVRESARKDEPISIFMGVPTMYTYLLSHFNDKMSREEQQLAREAASRLRLTISGSGACPPSLMKQWHGISGQTLLERYGMTEAGMILSNPLDGERRPGSVGLPMPGVQVRSVPLGKSSDKSEPEQGEIRVKGSNLFREYWNKPAATAKEFDEDGWFKTGDTGCCDGNPPYWRILGRTSVDIINSGGYKISALAIEDILLQHPAIGEVAVMGLPDEALGEIVAAVISPKENETVEEEDIVKFSNERLPPYQVPRSIKLADAIPRNAMGKINKKHLVDALFKS